MKAGVDEVGTGPLVVKDSRRSANKSVAAARRATGRRSDCGESCGVGEFGWHGDSSSWCGGERFCHQVGVAEAFQGLALGELGVGPACFEPLHGRVQVVFHLCHQIFDIATPPHLGAERIEIAVDQDVLGHGDPFNTLATASENSPQARRCSPSAPRPRSVSRYVRLLLPCTTDHSLDR